MPKFSQDSFSKLSECHHDLQVLFFEIIKHVDCKIAAGYRNEEDQNKAYEGGFSKLKFPFSRHNQRPSLAVDVYFYPVEMKNVKKFYWFAGYVLAVAQQLKEQGKIMHSVKWGGDFDMDGDFNDQSLIDLPHFELVV